MPCPRALLAVLAAWLAFSGCKTQPPPEPEGPRALTELRKAHKAKQRKRKPTKPATPPTRSDGAAALQEGRALLDEADFAGAEAEFKIAAAAGTEGADEELFKVRSELAAETSLLTAHRKLLARDVAGARAQLASIPSGLILSEVAEQMLAELDSAEAERRQDVAKRAAQNISDEAKADEGEKDE